MKIAHIEQIPIAMPLAKCYDNHAGRMRMYDIDQHIVVKVHGDNGLVGYGDYEDNPRPVPQAEIDALIGTNPFDYLLNNFHMGLGMALYDLMGKHVGVPAHKLMGRVSLKLHMFSENRGLSLFSWLVCKPIATHPCVLSNREV